MQPDQTSGPEETTPPITAAAQPQSESEATLLPNVFQLDSPPHPHREEPRSGIPASSPPLAALPPHRDISARQDLAALVAWLRRIGRWLIAHCGFWLAMVAIGFGLLGQRIYSSFNGSFQEDYGDAPKLYLIGCSLIVIAFLFTYKTRVFFRSGSYQSPAAEAATISNNIVMALRVAWARPANRRLFAIPWWRFALLAGAGLTAWLGVSRWLAIPLDGHNGNDLGAIGYWVISVTLLVFACVLQRHDTWPLNALNRDEYAAGAIDEDGRAGDGGWAFANHRLEIALVAAIILVAAALRLYNLGGVPTGVFGDEAYLGLIARQIEHGNFMGAPFLGPGPWYNVPSMVSYLIVPGMWLLGDTSIAALRFTTALSGVVTVFFMYLLLRLMFKGRTALIGASLLAVSDVQIQFSRYTQGTEQIATCWVICFYFLYKGLRTKRYLDFVWSGLAAGFSLYLYPSSRLIAVLLVLMVGYLFVRRLSFVRDYWSHIAVCAFATLLMAAPILGYTLKYPTLFGERMQAVYVNYGGAAQETFQRWGIPLPTDPPYTGAAGPLSVAAVQNVIKNWNQGWSKMLWSQTRVTYLVLNATADRDYFYTTGLPLLNPTEAILTILGMAYFLWRWRDPRYMLFNIWFWPGMFIAVAMTVGAPDVLRLAGLPPAWVAFPAVLLNKIVYEAEKTGWFVRPELRNWMRRRSHSLRRTLTPSPQPALAMAGTAQPGGNMMMQTVGSAVAYPTHPARRVYVGGLPTRPANRPTADTRLPTRPLARRAPATKLPTRVVRKPLPVVHKPRTGPAYLNLVLALVVLLWGAQNINTYFSVYPSTFPWIGNDTQARYIAALGSGYHVYFMGMHQFYYGYALNTYRAPNVEGADFFNPPALLPIHDRPTKDAAFLIFPYHQPFLDAVKQYYPNGASSVINYVSNHSLAFTSYVVPRTQIASSQALTARYYATTDLATNAPGVARATASSFSLSDAPHSPPPDLSYPASIRWEGNLYAPAYGLYTLELKSTDQAGKPAPVSLHLDGQPWLNLSAGEASSSANLVFAQGWHHLSLRAALPNASQRISLRWRIANQPLADIPANYFYNGPLSGQQYGLIGEYAPLGQAVAARRVDPFIGFMNTADLVQSNQPFTIIWRGSLIAPRTDSYSFNITAEGATTLKIDGQPILSGGPDRGGEQPLSGAALPLTAGAHKIEIDYQWRQDFGSIKLYWSYPSQPGGSGLIPSSALRPDPSIWRADQLTDFNPANAPYPVATSLATQQTPALVIPRSGQAPFSHPQGSGVDLQGNIFVGQDQPPHVYKFDKSGKQVADWPVLPDTVVGAARLFDLAVDNRGQVYVLDPVGKTLEVYDNSGKLIGHRNTNNKFAAYAPSGLAVDSAGNVYIANTGGSDIIKIDPNDNLVKVISGDQDFPTVNGKIDPHRADQPFDVTVGDDGSVYVVDLHQRIIKYTPDGKYVAEWRIGNIGGGTASMHLASYKNVVYISDNAAGGIYMLNTSDGSISLLGGPGSDAGQFANPSGLATDPSGRLYVADRDNNRVQVFDNPAK